MNKRRKILAAMLAAFMLLVPMVSTAQIDIKGDGGETSDLSGTWGTMRITDNETEEYVPLGEGLWLLAGAAGLYLLVKSRKTRKATAVAAAALALTLGTTQCKKTEESVIPAGETISISFMAGNGAKADISVYTGRITWEKDDEVYVVYGGKLLSETPLLATPVDQNPVNASISGTITTTVTIEGDNPSFTFYYVGSGVNFNPEADLTSLTFNISNQIGKNGAALNDAGEYMVGRTEAVEMEKNEGGTYVPSEDGAKHFDPLTSVLRLDTKAFGAGQMTMSSGNNKMEIDLANPGAPIYNPGPITFTGGADVRISVVPTTTAGDVTLSFSGNGKDGSIIVKNGIKEGRIYSKVINNAGYPIPVEANESGILPGLFSVANGKQVYFSKGNLWADGSKALHFEDAQWKFTSSYNTLHVSHFTWSDNVTNAVSSDLAYSGNNLFCDESHKQSVDGSEAVYYALSNAEWQYLLNLGSYQNAIRNGKCKWASVGEYHGYVIAPDDFTGTIADYYANDAALATGNLVFLPAAGDRWGATFYDPTYGLYWSSTPNGDGNAWGLVFGTYNLYADNTKQRGSSFSVRLVTNAN